MRKYKFKIGIDVGIDGGIVVLDEEMKIAESYRIQKMKDQKGKDVIDLAANYKILKSIAEKCNDCLFLLEKNHSIHLSGAAANFSFGQRDGELQAMLIVLEQEYGVGIAGVTPKEWQKVVWIPEDRVYKTRTKLNTKATSLNSSQRLFPGEKFLATNRSYTPHDGIVDAALIAAYSYIKDLNI